MPRNPRVHVPGGIYHVILRGNAREPLFFSNRDYLILNDLVGEIVLRYELEVYAFCWMTNHMHAVVRIGEKPLSQPIQWLATQYARYLNWRRNRSGHVFERRHRAFLVEKERYLAHLVRYIHRNPVQAGLVRHAEDYRWSSHRAYLGKQFIQWLSPQPVLTMFSATNSTACAEFASFVGAGHDDETAEILFDGYAGHQSGIRPQISPVAALRSLDLDQLVRSYCACRGLTRAELRSPSRQQIYVRARAEIAETAIREHDFTLVEVAGYFKRAPRVLGRCIERYRGQKSATEVSRLALHGGRRKYV